MTTDDALEGPTPADIEKLRKECRQTWLEALDVTEPHAWYPLRGGPADGEQAPRTGPTFTGSWVTDKGDVVKVTYEWVKDPDHDGDWFGEFAGLANTRLIADELTEEFFAGQRGEPEEELEEVDLDAMTVAEALAFLTEDNERRITGLFELTNGQVDLENAFDVTFLKIFVNRILLFMSPMIHEEASLEFQNERSKLLDRTEDKYEEFQTQREQAMAQARLSMQGPPPGPMPGPQHQGRVTLPSRRIRRGN